MFDDTNITKNNLSNYIFDLEQSYFDKKFPLSQDDFTGFVCNIFTIINAELDRFSKALLKNIKFVKKNQINLKEEYKIETKGEIKNFTSRKYKKKTKKLQEIFKMNLIII